jgi:sugar diacid utilization regulator
MNRLRAANALNIHPRTLDYRIHRVRDLTGLHPASARGVRVIGAAIAHAMRSGK